MNVVSPSARVCGHVHPCVYMRVPLHLHVFMCVCMYVPPCMCVYMCMFSNTSHSSKRVPTSLQFPYGKNSLSPQLPGQALPAGADSPRPEACASSQAAGGC